MTVSNRYHGASYATDDTPTARAADRSCREGRTVRLKREIRDSEGFYEDAR